MSLLKIKQSIFNIINPQDKISISSWIYHIFMGIVILASSIAVIVELSVKDETYIVLCLYL